MSKKQLLAAILFLSIALSASATLADLSGTTTGVEQGEALQDARDAEADRRLLEQFRAAQLSLTQAIEVAEGLHRGSRAAAAAFELSDSAAYRVITVKSGEAWENLIDANTGRVIGPELASSLDEFESRRAEQHRRARIGRAGAVGRCARCREGCIRKGFRRGTDEAGGEAELLRRCPERRTS